jgi:hypothetical protein
MKKTVAAGATREATVVMDNKVGDMVTRDMVDNRVTRDMDSSVEVANMKVMVNNVDKDMVDSKVVRVMADMVNKGTEDTADREIADSKVDGVNTKAMVNSVDLANRVDRDMADSKADGVNTKVMANKAMVNNVVTDNRNTVAMASNMKVNMVPIGTMAEADIVKMKMNPACRDVTRADRIRIMMKTMMKMMTIMACRDGMEKKMMITMKTRMKMTTVK